MAVLLALVATFACAGTNASAAPLKLTPSITTIARAQPTVYTVTTPDRTVDQTKMPNAADYHSVVSLRLATAANRSVIKATSTPDDQSPRTLNRKAIPGSPVGLEVTPGIQEAKLSWAPPDVKGFGIDYYLVAHQPGDGSLAFETTTLSTTIKNLTGDTEYTFWLRASNDSGDSSPAIKRATVQSSPPPPPPVEVAVAAAAYSDFNMAIVFA